MEEIVKYLKRRIAHAERRVVECKSDHGETPNQTHNYFGGHRLGYLEGKLLAYTDILEEIEETK